MWIIKHGPTNIMASEILELGKRWHFIILEYLNLESTAKINQSINQSIKFDDVVILQKSIKLTNSSAIQWQKKLKFCM